MKRYAKYTGEDIRDYYDPNPWDLPKYTKENSDGVQTMKRYATYTGEEIEVRFSGYYDQGSITGIEIQDVYILDVPVAPSALPKSLKENLLGLPHDYDLEWSD